MFEMLRDANNFQQFLRQSCSTLRYCGFLACSFSLFVAGSGKIKDRGLSLVCLLIQPYQLKDFLGHLGADWKTNQIFSRLGGNGKIMSPRAARERSEERRVGKEGSCS